MTNVEIQPHRPNKDCGLNASELVESGRMPALRCADWFGLLFTCVRNIDLPSWEMTSDKIYDSNNHRYWKKNQAETPPHPWIFLFFITHAIDEHPENEAQDQKTKYAVHHYRGGVCSCRPISGQPRGAGSDGVADAGEMDEDGWLPALGCTGWIGASSAISANTTRCAAK